MLVSGQEICFGLGCSGHLTGVGVGQTGHLTGVNVGQTGHLTSVGVGQILGLGVLGQITGGKVEGQRTGAEQERGDGVGEQAGQVILVIIGHNVGTALFSSFSFTSKVEFFSF